MPKNIAVTLRIQIPLSGTTGTRREFLMFLWIRELARLKLETEYYESWSFLRSHSFQPFSPYTLHSSLFSIFFPEFLFCPLTTPTPPSRQRLPSPLSYFTLFSIHSSVHSPSTIPWLHRIPSLHSHPPAFKHPFTPAPNVPSPLVFSAL